MCLFLLLLFNLLSFCFLDLLFFYFFLLKFALFCFLDLPLFALLFVVAFCRFLFFVIFKIHKVSLGPAMIRLGC